MKEYLIKLTKAKKRVGRGISSGQGKTAGRGQDGQKSRKSGRVRPGFEGGQPSINIRLPKGGGFYHPKKESQIINLDQLEKRLKKNKTIAGQVLDYSKFKVLGKGELGDLTNFTIRVAAISKSARKKLEQVGGRVELVSKYEK